MPSKRYYRDGTTLRHGAETLGGGVEPPPVTGGSFRPESTIFGSSAGAPAPLNSSPELDTYRAFQNNKVGLFDHFQAEYSAKARSLYPATFTAGHAHTNANPLMGMFHNYDSGMLPSTVAASSVGMILTRNLAGCFSFKAPFGSVAAQNHNAVIIDFVQSYAGTKNLYVILNHEPSNDGAGGAAWSAAEAQDWRDDQARLAKLILDNRGTRPVIPTLCAINYDIKGDNNGPASYHNCAPEMLALGVDLDEVVFSVDGYDTSPIQLGGAANLYSTNEVTRGWGFKRYAVSEGACKSYSTSAPNDRALADEWMAELADVCRAIDIEYYAWFASGVGGRANQITSVNEGWWIYGDQNKAQFARMCRGLI